MAPTDPYGYLLTWEQELLAIQEALKMIIERKGADPWGAWVINADDLAEELFRPGFEAGLPGWRVILGKRAVALDLKSRKMSGRKEFCFGNPKDLGEVSPALGKKPGVLWSRFLNQGVLEGMEAEKARRDEERKTRMEEGIKRRESAGLIPKMKGEN